MKNKPLILSGPDGDPIPSGQCDCDDGDCACSPAVLPSQIFINELMVEDRIKLASTSNKLALNDEFSVWFGPGHRPLVLNRTASEIVSLFTKACSVAKVSRDHVEIEPNILYDVVYQLRHYGLLVDADHVLKIESSLQVISAWIHVTDRCNLRCEYCYLPHVREDMSWETGIAAIDAIFKSATEQSVRKVKIKYAGGEPLIRPDFLFDLQAFAMEKAKATNIELDGIVLSNGTLLNAAILQKMRLFSLRLMVSLDGLGEQHNIQRPYAGGKGSFDDVKRGILLALNFGIRPDISITISDKNAYGVAEVVEWVLENDLPFSLNFYRENDFSREIASLHFEEDIIIRGMLETYKVIEKNLPRRSLLASLVDRANLSAPHLKTCGVGQNYLVFDQNGKVAKCQMAMRHPVSDINSENLLQVIQEDTTGIQNLSVDEKEGCKNCEWKYWCAGGCPLVTHRATGRYDVKSPNCRIYKTLYPEAIRLEGLRILKYVMPSSN